MSEIELSNAPKDEYTSKWVPIINAYERSAEKWTKRCLKIIKRYKDDRNARESTANRYNILWSNIETLKPALFAKTPKADVQRRFKDKDPVGLQAADVLERCLDYCMEQHAFGSTMRQGVLDYLLTARGTAWARYKPHMRDMEVTGTEATKDDGVQVTDDAAVEGEPAETPQEVYYEEALSDYVHWQDFGHTDARVWEEVTGVWRIVYLTKEQCKERFGDELGDKVPLDFTPKGMDGQGAADALKKATIYEIWDRNSKKAIWISKHYPEKLDARDDPLELDKFFPCPRPLYGTMANDSLIPVPDYVEYQDQADELDSLTSRIAAITKAIKVAGVYDASAEGVQRLLAEGVENQLIPVEQWAIFAEKGGLTGVMELLPVQEIAQTLLHLYEAREKVLADLYQITGMADIIRGATNPNETATAQKIKSNFVTMRLDERQREVQRYTRNQVENLGQIIAGHFSLDTIKQMSGVKLMTQEEKQKSQEILQTQQQQAQQQAQPGQQPPKPPEMPDQIKELMGKPSWEEVHALLQNETARCFRIDIETDSTIAGDEEQDKQDAMEFVKVVGGFVQQLGELPPGLQPMMGEMLMFVVRRFSAGKSLESTIEEAVEAMDKASKQPPGPPQPDPTEMAKIQAQGQMHGQTIQADQQAAQMQGQITMQIEQGKAQAAAQLKERELAMQATADERKAQLDAALQQSAQQSKDQLAAHQATLEAQNAEAQRQHEAMLEQMRIASAEGIAARAEATKIVIAEISAKVQTNALEQKAEDRANATAAAGPETPDPRIDKLMEAMATMAETMSAEKELVRDPTTGKATGLRLVKKAAA